MGDTGRVRLIVAAHPVVWPAVVVLVLALGGCSGNTDRHSSDASVSGQGDGSSTSTKTAPSGSAGCAEAAITTNLSAAEFAAAAVQWAHESNTGLFKDAVASTADAELQQLQAAGTADLIAQTPPGGQGNFARRVCEGMRKLHPEFSSGIPRPYLLFNGYGLCTMAKTVPGVDAFKPGPGQAPADIKQNAAYFAAAAHEMLCPQL